MSRFLNQARELLEVASADATACDHAILIHPLTGIRIVSNCDWPLESLKAHHGAAEAYRIVKSDHCVRVEGRATRQSCVLESKTAHAALRQLLFDQPLYAVSSPPILLEA